MTIGHLARRYWWSITARPLSADTRSWVEGHLLAGERRMFSQMSVADQRHQVQVARRFQRSLRGDVRREWMAAALLHDVGKTVCGLGTTGRVIATLVRVRAGDGRIARYHRHEPIGASLLAIAGSAPETVLLVSRSPEVDAAVAGALLVADAV
ncbi:MAG: hypothetical protein ACKOD2_13865 [Ilumatobacteraceae bacterium]